jgi:hypothetical protein
LYVRVQMQRYNSHLEWRVQMQQMGSKPDKRSLPLRCSPPCLAYEYASSSGLSVATQQVRGITSRPSCSPCRRTFIKIMRDRH